MTHETEESPIFWIDRERYDIHLQDEHEEEELVIEDSSMIQKKVCHEKEYKSKATNQKQSHIKMGKKRRKIKLSSIRTIDQTHGKEDLTVPQRPKFIGGAERARRKAQRAMRKFGIKNVRHEKQKQQKKSRTNQADSVQTKIKPHERLYASILLSRVHEIQQSNHNTDTRTQLMQEICHRAEFPVPATLPVTYSNSHQFYQMLGALVLEEARYILSDALIHLEKQTKVIPLRLLSMSVRSTTGFLTMSFFKSKHGHGLSSPIFPYHSSIGDISTSHQNNDSSPNFLPSIPFTVSEMTPMRPGSIFLLTLVSTENGSSFFHTACSSSSSSFNTTGPLENETSLGKRKRNDTDSTIEESNHNSSITHTVIPEYSVLATFTSFRQDESKETLTLLIFRPETWLRNLFSPIQVEGNKDTYYRSSRWTIQPVASLLSEQRQLEVCLRAPKVSFLPTLLGFHPSQHIRFHSDNDQDRDDDNDRSTSHHVDSQNKLDTTMGESSQPKDSFVSSCTTVHDPLFKREKESDISPIIDKTKRPCSSIFPIPTLNDTQEQAALKFLYSEPGKITFVQGPPGSGKTTFLVSVILRSFFPTHPSCRRASKILRKKQVLVTAPSNKAISVIATRILKVIENIDEVPLNIVLIGVKDKLMSDEVETDGKNIPHGTKGVHDDTDDDAENDVLQLSSSLQGIFVYTFIPTVIAMYRAILNDLETIEKTNIKSQLKSLLQRINGLHNRMRRSIPKNSRSCGYFKVSKTLVDMLKSIYRVLTVPGKQSPFVEIILRILSEIPVLLNEIIGCLEATQSTSVVGELLKTANIIFCTLTMAGNCTMNALGEIQDLFIDEAAAATEPELCIPYRFLPQRMLAVGDPKQLPAYISSRFAKELGLNKSLHDRMMNDPGCNYVMLDIQYRMRPCISCFPSRQFYHEKLLDAPTVSSPDYRGDIGVLNGAPYYFFHVQGQEQQCSTGGSFYNTREGEVVVALVECIRSEALTAGIAAWHLPNRVRILTFYQAQVSFLRKILHSNGLGQVSVASVDSSQGCEADIVIVSFVRSNVKNTKTRYSNLCRNFRTTVGFLHDDRRLNVSLTRAKFQLLCVGNVYGTLLKAGKTLKEMAVDALDRNVVVSLDQEHSGNRQQVSMVNKA